MSDAPVVQEHADRRNVKVRVMQASCTEWRVCNDIALKVLSLVDGRTRKRS